MYLSFYIAMLHLGSSDRTGTDFLVKIHLVGNILVPVITLRS